MTAPSIVLDRPARRASAHLDLSSLGSVLGIWAHPDDEVYLTGGLMRMLVDEGQPVTCVTATRGEQGTNAHARFSPDRLADIRAAELAESLDILGVIDHHQLDLPDGALGDVDPEVGAAVVRAVIESARPDTVVTFGPDGFTGHPDHRAVSRWAADAVADAGRGIRLLHVARTADWWDGPGRWIDVTMDPDDPTLPAITPPAHLAVDLELDGATLDRKVAALYAHTSQVAWVLDVMGHERFRRWVAREQFVDGGC